MGFNDIYLFIQNRVCELTHVKHFDLWAEQPFTEGGEAEIYDTPAVFLEWAAPIETLSIGNNKQEAEVSFTLHLETDAKGNADNLADTNERIDGLEHLQIADLIFAKLQGYNGNTTNQPISSIGRTAFTSIPLGETVLTSQTFRCFCILDAAARKFEAIAKPTLTNAYPTKP